MKNIPLPPFYIGQRVVALNSSKDKKVKKGLIYTVAYCVKNNCKHSKSGWDVGLKEHPGTEDRSCCAKCGGVTYHDGYFYLCGEAAEFAPIQETFETISYEKVRELESPLINAN